MIDKVYEETIRRSTFFRDVQLWPLVEDLDYKGWLDNFRDKEEKRIACHILDFFIYYPKKMVDYMLMASVGYAGYELQKRFKDWNHEYFKKKCIYSFIPGENPSPTDSGHIFLRKLRDSLHISEKQIIDFKDLHKKLESASEPYPVIFVDDFVGSGLQCITAWRTQYPIRDTLKLSLEEISHTYGHQFVYAPLIVNKKGYENIKKYCTNLILSTVHILGDEYNLFSPDCICWNNDIDLYNKGIDLIIKSSQRLGIPIKGVTSIKGFHEQGLAIAFEHGIPDAVPAFFYWCDSNWTPLIPKSYERIK